MALRRPQRDTPPIDEPETTESAEFELPPVRTLTLKEGREFFDMKARQLLGMSGAEFVARYESGEYDDVLDDEDHRGHLYLAMLSGLGASGEPITKAKASPLAHRRQQKVPRETIATDDDGYPLPPIRVLDREESRAFFDDTARELLGISSAEFVERWNAGEYSDILDDPAHSEIMYLTLLGNLGRQK